MEFKCRIAFFFSSSVFGKTVQTQVAVLPGGAEALQAAGSRVAAPVGGIWGDLTSSA